MPESKKDRLQRQASEKLQARSTTIIPTHRQSIVKRDQSPIVPRRAGTMAPTLSSLGTGQTGPPSASLNRPNRPRAPSRPPPNPPALDQLPPQTGEWMTRFCVEPPDGDSNACCLAVWVPSVLYGKVNWRFVQKWRGESIDDWKASKGCNGPCWAYWAMSLIGIAGWHGLISGNVLLQDCSPPDCI